MALLGHTARVIVSTTALVASADAWQRVGFAVHDQSEGFARLTDGQVLLTLIEDVFPSPALAYFHADPEQLARDLQDRGIEQRDVSAKGLTITPFLGVDVYVHQRSSDKAERHTGERNNVLGYLDAFSVGLPDVSAARRTAEDLGYFVQEEWGMPAPRSDVTDGLITIAFQQRTASPYLAYAVEITDELIEHLQELEGVTVQVREINGDISYIRLTMPEGTQIVLLHDNNYE